MLAMIKIIMDSIYKILLKANTIGFWQALTALSALGGFVLALNFVRTRSYSRGLNFFTQHVHSNDNYPNKIIIEIRNYSGKTVIITNPYFKFGKVINPDENGRCDSYVKEYEIKFAGEHKTEINKLTGETKTIKYLEEVDIMLRHKESTSTWIPISPSEDDSSVKSALEKHKIGILYCNTVWLEDKPKVIRIRKKI